MSAPLLNIVADAHIWGAESAFSSIPGYEVKLTLLEHSQISREALGSADILLTRSSTQVGGALLAGTPVRFAATATIGDDHFDKQWLDANGIAWANAAGSSTGSVVEYMASVLLQLHARGLIQLPDLKLGIVGVGRIGSAVAGICAAAGIATLLNDPPRARAEGAAFANLDTLLAEADVITLHTPLIREGEDRTEHLVDARFLERFRGRGLINAARGACVDNRALLAWLEGDPSRWAVLDCWEGEPRILRALLQHPRVVIATPHIAGHSLDGKAANTQFAYNSLCRFLGVQPVWRAEAQLPPAVPAHLEACGGDVWEELLNLAVQLYPIMDDHDAMRSWEALDDEAMAAAFGRYRRNYPVRRSWSACGALLPSGCAALKEMAEKFGIPLLGSGG